MARASGLAVALLIAACSRETIVYPDLAYHDDGNPRHQLDLYKPDSNARHLPTILLIHGGGFTAGDKGDVQYLAVQLAGQGYAIVAPAYRLAPESQYPSQIQDVACAYSWVFQNADSYGLDTRRIALVGISAGGNLAALLATVDRLDLHRAGCPHPLGDTSSIRAVVLFYPVVDLMLLVYGESFEPYIGSPPDTNPSLWREASPLRWIQGDEPPFLLIHGTWDVRVPMSESEQLRAALEEAGTPVELLRILQADHDFLLEYPDGSASTESIDAVLRFLDENLRE